jgi:hypothetical protein
MKMKINDGGPAFPMQVRMEHSEDQGKDYRETIEDPGMSLRDWFAGQALAGLISVQKVEHISADSLAKSAYNVADGMLAERKVNRI